MNYAQYGFVSYINWRILSKKNDPIVGWRHTRQCDTMKYLWKQPVVDMILIRLN